MAQEGLTRSRSRSTDQNERLEPQLLRAAENDDVELLSKIIDAARIKNQLSDNFLRIGLMRSSEKGKINTTQYLLAQGAQPDGAPGNRLSPLLRAVERNHIAIVQLLLEHANPDTADKKGRTALMTAAWLNHWHILNSLIVKGADVNAKDHRGRNVLHNLAADKKCDWGDSVIERLLVENIHIDGKEGHDLLGRTPLHWACATGKLRMVELLLTRPKGPKAHINAVEIREKTSLHLAAAHDRDDIVELLLKYDADYNAKSDGGWTPLHNACEVGSETIVRVLIGAGSDVNAKLLNGMTPLHLAAQGGHIEAVKLLLERKDIKRNARDTFGSTPFLRAAQSKQKDIVSLLAPFNNLESLSEDALGACNGFNATIVDFGNFHNENRVKRWTVYGMHDLNTSPCSPVTDNYILLELLYGRDPVNARKPKFTILPNDKATNFRWIHLPANNMAWVESLLTKVFIEEGSSDVEGFKALERSFSNQHRGQQSHSHFMRPLCQSTVRTVNVPEGLPVESVKEKGPPAIVINGGSESAGMPSTPSRSSTFQKEGSDLFKSSNQGWKDQSKSAQKAKGRKASTKGDKSSKGTETPSKDQQRKSSQPLDSRRPISSSSLGRKEPTQPKNNIFTFMPYLHFESSRRRQEMQEAIKRAETLRSPLCRALGKASTFDEMLIRAHLTSSTVSLHVRRTLDQSFYHNIDTESRDQDQVVYRYQLKGKNHDDPDVDPKIVMVDQLWMWILGKSLILTAFPQRWQQPKNDPLNVLDSIIEDINSKTREPVKSVYELAMTITNRCKCIFDLHRMGDEDYQFLDMFESSIGNVTDRETVLFREFNAASAQASAWLQHHRRPNRLSKYLQYSTVGRKDKKDAKQKDREELEEKFKHEEFMRGPLFVDKLLDIGQETDLLAETKDIRDELNMIAKVLEDQLHVLPDLQDAVCDIYKDEQLSQQEVKKRFRDQMKSIEVHLKDIDRMDRQAERIYNSITDMLDLKQKHANAFEARFARDQAAGTARQSQTIMVFTIVTIIFLPLSFIATFFTINVSEFGGPNGNPNLPLGYVSKYMFGIGFAVSIPLIVIALSLKNIGDMFSQTRRWINHRRNLRKENAVGAGTGEPTLDMLRFDHAISIARSARKSVEANWIRERLSMSGRPTTGTVEREKPTGFRMRANVDVERGGNFS